MICVLLWLANPTFDFKKVQPYAFEYSTHIGREFNENDQSSFKPKQSKQHFLPPLPFSSP